MAALKEERRTLRALPKSASVGNTSFDLGGRLESIEAELAELRVQLQASRGMGLALRGRWGC